MSSITEPRSERGQILIIFAFSLLVIFGVAALVFDGGSMLLEKRTQQNAADAAAMAGARFLPGNVGAAEAAAFDLAANNGFTTGGDQTVTVNIPPVSGPNSGCGGCVEVLIDAEKPSFFAGIWGIFSHDVGSRAVGVNEDRALGPWGMLALENSACGALDIGGGGQLYSLGDIQVNSNCQPNAMWLRGQGEVLVAPNVGCNVVGGYSQGGNSSSNCEVTSPVPAIPDPFLALDPYEPPVPTDPDTGQIVYPTPPLQLGGSPTSIPTGCPGAATNPATHTSPRLCRFGSSLSGTTWRLFPGYYPGGLDFQAGTFYLEPGIYHVADGGINMNGNGATIRSVNPGGTTLGGGVLLFNGRHPTAGADDVQLNGGSAGIDLWPIQTGTWAGIVVYQSSTVCLDVQLNGAASTMQVRGTIYVPCGEVVFNGNGGTITTDQIVSETFKMTGNSGGLNILYDENYLPTFTVAGLIE